MMRRMKFELLTFVALVMLSLAGCKHTPAPDVGEAPAARLPVLSEELAEPAKGLPPSTAQTLPDVIREGIETDRAYNALALRYNALLGIYECVRKELPNRDEEALEACLDK